MKKIITFLLVVTLTATAAIGGTLAYFTDRDSKANVFTVGNVAIDLEEDFDQGATLIPGVDIEKKPTITNVGPNDAWVWLEFAIPSALDNAAQGTEQGSNENVIHWNPKGATTEGYVNDARVQAAIDAGFFDDLDTTNLTADYINTNKMHWNVFNSIAEGQNMYQKQIEGVDYNVYVLLYNKALTPGETTLPNIEKVFLDARVDIDPDGNWNFVEGGVATPISWNSETNGNPIIYVSAYAMQAEGFADARAAYAAYQTQWGDNGAEYGESAIPIYGEANLKAAAESGGYAILMADINVSSTTYVTADLTLDMNGHTISDVDEAEVTVMLYASSGATLTITGNGTVYSEDHNQFMLGAASGSEIIVENGSFIKAPYEWGKDCGYEGCTGGTSHTTNAQNLSPVIWSKGVITVYDGYFDCGILNSDYVEKNSRPVVHDCMYPTINLSIDAGSGHVFIYGGTFVNANPVDGDDNPRGSTNEGNQNATEKAFFLYGQTEYGVIPDGYTITQGIDEYERVTHTVSYNGD